MAQKERRDGDFRIDVRLERPTGDLLLEVKRTSTAVDIRGVLLSLAYVLTNEPPNSIAVCVLIDTRLTSARMKDELNRFRAAVHPTLASRVYLVAVRDGNVEGDLPHGDSGLLSVIVESARRESARPASRVTQQAVKTAALSRWLATSGRLGVAEMQRATGASMPTVIAAFRAMQHDGLVYPRGSDGWQLAEQLSWDSVRRMVEAHGTERRVIRFKDPGDHARSPMEMAKRLLKMEGIGERMDIALGGVLGAEQRYPDLDITGPPRLDLCVYDGDTRFVRKLDAGLDETTNPADKAVLALHMTRDPQVEPRKPGRLRSASVIDCVADLLEMGLQAEARDFWHAMSSKRTSASQRQDEQA